VKLRVAQPPALLGFRKHVGVLPLLYLPQDIDWFYRLPPKREKC
jgi:hypothetical protein